VGGVKKIDLSVVLPCLNEAETLQIVVEKSLKALKLNGLRGEIIVADNGSTDGSQAIAKKAGAVVIDVPVRGYGAALKAGINAAQGRYVVMGDADDSYALDALAPFISKLDDGFELVMGNRFAGGIEKGAMPWLHKYVGNPVLSFIGRLFFKIQIKDFHCGLRAFKRDSVLKLNLNCTGMEFASEMVVKAALHNLKIAEVPTTLKKDGRSRAPHLRTWRDGWRHLIFLLMASPRWLFLYPGLLLTLVGFVGMVSTARGAVHLGGFAFNMNTYFLSLGFLLVGIQTILLAILARIFSARHGILPKSKNMSYFEKYFTLERGIIIGLGLVFSALIGLGFLLFDWTGSAFRGLSIYSTFRISGLFVLGLTSGIQILFASFFASMIQV
jgi:glycosyltransferase involved in cell wall biosynthesis